MPGYVAISQFNNASYEGLISPLAGSIGSWPWNDPPLFVRQYCIFWLFFGAIGVAEIDKSKGKLACSIINVNSFEKLGRLGGFHRAGRGDRTMGLLVWRAEMSLTNNSGYFVLRSLLSGLAVDVLDISTANGASVIQWTVTNAANQQWTMTPR